jgi:hypothetical protein
LLIQLTLSRLSGGLIQKSIKASARSLRITDFT